MPRHWCFLHHGADKPKGRTREASCFSEVTAITLDPALVLIPHSEQTVTELFALCQAEQGSHGVVLYFRSTDKSFGKVQLADETIATIPFCENI